ncbi:MAG TPA: hypothetical protein VM261_20660 [Kofleriaceae bacterium]|nr:hypothetical protein [Kofleriaceae bacterium]
MALRRLLPIVALAIACSTATASAETLVMVSPPPELDAAVRTSLAPWRVQIIVVQLASGSPAELALAQGAGFVVWADDDELVLWDAGAGVGERRDIPAEMDDANAAALALSIKTWMHLGAPPVDSTGREGDGDVIEPPPGGSGDIHDVVPVPAPPLEPPLLRAEAATGLRGNMTDAGRTSTRVMLSAVGRLGPVDLALGFELGSASAAGDDVATGELSMMELSVHARWPVPLGPALTLSPAAGLALVRSSFSGVDNMDRALSASDSAPALDAAAIVEWRPRWFDRLVIGAEVGASYVLVSQRFEDRNMRLATPAHIEPRGLVRVGLVLR